jgi:ABC-type microcin C transport system permease subunit YejE
MPSNRAPSKRIRFATRIIVTLSQMVACAMCLLAVHDGIVIGLFGAASCALVAIILALSPDTDAT